MSISIILVGIKILLTFEYVWTKHFFFIILTINIHKYYILNRTNEKKNDLNLLLILNHCNNYDIFYEYTHGS